MVFIISIVCIVLIAPLLFLAFGIWIEVVTQTITHILRRKMDGITLRKRIMDELYQMFR